MIYVEFIALIAIYDKEIYYLLLIIDAFIVNRMQYENYSLRFVRRYKISNRKVDVVALNNN